MKRKVLLCVAILLSMAFVTAKAQTYAYKCLYSVDDNGIKRKSIVENTIFYFTFTNDKSMCYSTDKNGIYSLRDGLGSYRYIGTRNGMYVYKECSTNIGTNMFGQNILYFKSDYSRLNWDCSTDRVIGEHTIRVLTLYKEKDSTPSHLY